MFTDDQLKNVSPNDKRELNRFIKYLKLKRSKKGRKYIKTQKVWKDYENGKET